MKETTRDDLASLVLISAAMDGAADGGQQRNITSAISATLPLLKPTNAPSAAMSFILSGCRVEIITSAALAPGTCLRTASSTARPTIPPPMMPIEMRGNRLRAAGYLAL